MQTTNTKMQSCPVDPEERARQQATRDIRETEGTFLPSSSSDDDILSLNHMTLKPGVRNLKIGS